MSFPDAVPPLEEFRDSKPVRQGPLNALSRHVEHLHTHLLGGWRTRKPLSQIFSSVAGVIGQAIPGDNLQYFIDGFDQAPVDTELDHPDGRSTYVDCVRVRTSGVYLLTGQVTLKSNTATGGGVLIAHLALNGITLQQDAVGRVAGRYPGTAGASACLTVLQPLVAGSVVRLLVGQASGTSAPLDNANGGCRITAEWLAPLGAPEDLRLSSVT